MNGRSTEARADEARVAAQKGVAGRRRPALEGKLSQQEGAPSRRDERPARAAAGMRLEDDPGRPVERGGFHRLGGQHFEQATVPEGEGVAGAAKGADHTGQLERRPCPVELSVP